MTTDRARIIALDALAFVLGQDRLGARFIALTGLDRLTLQERLEDPLLLAAVLEFLLAHEPDLMAYASAVTIGPEQIALAACVLSRETR